MKKTVDISEILTGAILLEKGVRDLYENIADSTDNVEIARILEILAVESGAHAKQLESCYGILVKPESIKAGIEGLLSTLSERIVKVKEKTNPVEVLREGIRLEGYIEQLYKGLSDSYKLEEQLYKSLGEGHGEASKIYEVFKQIAADEKEHQDLLQNSLSQILKGEIPKEFL